MRQLKIEKNVITLRESRSIELYLLEVEKLPLITAEEEATLAKKIREGDDVAFQKLVKGNLRFVISVAKKYQHNSGNLSLIDLINEGNVGLMIAARRFDESKGFKFISYAVWWIRQSIMQALSEQSKIVKLPSNKNGIFLKLREAKDRFEAMNEREPTLEELEEIFKEHPQINKKTIQEAEEINKRAFSLDRPLAEDTDTCFLDVYENPHGNQIPEEMENESIREKINLLIAQLKPQEQRIIKSHFGINQEAKNLDTIAIDVNLTRERVRQIKEKALRKMKHIGNRNQRVLERV